MKAGQGHPKLVLIHLKRKVCTRLILPYCRQCAYWKCADSTGLYWVRDELAPFQLIELHPVPASQDRIAGYRIASDQSAGSWKARREAVAPAEVWEPRSSRRRSRCLPCRHRPVVLGPFLRSDVLAAALMGCASFIRRKPTIRDGNANRARSTASKSFFPSLILGYISP